MIRMPSAFYNDAVQLSWRDVWTLIRGGEVRSGSLFIGLRRMPDNGCRCEGCKETRVMLGITVD